MRQAAKLSRNPWGCFAALAMTIKGDSSVLHAPIAVIASVSEATQRAGDITIISPYATSGKTITKPLGCFAALAMTIKGDSSALYETPPIAVIASASEATQRAGDITIISPHATSGKTIAKPLGCFAALAMTIKGDSSVLYETPSTPAHKPHRPLPRRRRRICGRRCRTSNPSASRGCGF